MADNRCTCDFLPCICVEGIENAVDLSGDICTERMSNGSAAMETPKSKLRQLFASDATSQCTGCMMLPCICPTDDDITTVGIKESAIMEATRPPVCAQYAGAVNEEIDEYGRVRLDAISTTSQVNNVWIAREIKPLLKPHQVEGVRFLHSHVAANRGCILADYMGLGKTLQVITVIHSFIVDEIMVRKQRSKNVDNCATISLKSKKGQDHDKCYEKPLATVLVMCPAICLSNWESEFRKWLSIKALAHCPVLTLDSSTTKGTIAGRLQLLQRWKRTGGVLLIGYEMFRGLLNPTTTPLSCATERDASIRMCSRLASATMEITSAFAQETAQLQRTAREFQDLLCTPGADLVVMDEGHRMKDPSSLLCQSVAQIQSPRRLVLTGYPVQNSLSEYWCMVNFARKGFLGSYDEFRAKYERPILEGNTIRSQELIELLQSVVLRRGKALLRSQLPPKVEWILYCKLSPVQHQLYCEFLNFYCNDGGVDLLTAYAALLQVMNHPDIVYSKLCPSEEDGSALLLEAENDFNSAMLALDDPRDWVWESEERLFAKQQTVAARKRRKRQKLMDTQKSSDWARSIIFGENRQGVKAPEHKMASRYHAQVLEHSGKMVVLLRIVEESLVCGDKVVVFSQSVPTLKVISDFLRASTFSPSRVADDAVKSQKHLKENTTVKAKRRQTVPRPNRDPAGILRRRQSSTGSKSSGSRKAAGATAAGSSATSSEWFLQIDGSTNAAKRMNFIQRFSSADSSVKLLLVSTRAGAEGINLHAANRIVLFDVSWNPSNDHQSMCRSHRIGQVKTVHVYRLVSTGTMERMIYEQQMKKVDLSTAVVDSHELVDRKKPAVDSSSPAASSASGLVRNEANQVPFSGFLQPPTEIDYDEQLDVDETIVKEDAVLASCVKQLGHWLVDVHRVHEPLADEK